MALQNNPNLITCSYMLSTKGDTSQHNFTILFTNDSKETSFFNKNTRLYEWQMLRVAKLIF